jgi:hypothetical protein
MKYTNKRYILSIILVVIIATGGILSYQYLIAPKEKTVIVKYIDEYLYKDAILGGNTGTPFMPPGTTYHGISSEEAILFAIQHLQAKGAKEIEVCETGWVAAPLGAFFVEGKVSLDIGTKHYSVFSIGIKDGSDYDEEDNFRKEWAVGNEYGFIARGEDDNGNIVWYPESDLGEFSGQVGRLESLSSWCK